MGRASNPYLGLMLKWNSSLGCEKEEQGISLEFVRTHNYTVTLISGAVFTCKCRLARVWALFSRPSRVAETPRLRISCAIAR